MTRILSVGRAGAGNSHPIPLATRRMAQIRAEALCGLLVIAAAFCGSIILGLIALAWRHPWLLACGRRVRV